MKYFGQIPQNSSFSENLDGFNRCWFVLSNYATVSMRTMDSSQRRAVIFGTVEQLGTDGLSGIQRIQTITQQAVSPGSE
jgi:hypothetical protein